MIGRQLPQNDQGSILQILLWFLFIVAILSVGARVGTKFYMTRKLSRDDWILIAAQVRSTHTPLPPRSWVSNP